MKEKPRVQPDGGNPAVRHYGAFGKRDAGGNVQPLATEGRGWEPSTSPLARPSCIPTRNRKGSQQIGRAGKGDRRPERGRRGQ